MDPLTIMAIASAVGGLFNSMKKTPGQSMFMEPAKLGSKSLMQAGNPYQTPMASTGQDPYEQTNPWQQMYRPNSLSSALGRYGGL